MRVALVVVSLLAPAALAQAPAWVAFPDAAPNLETASPTLGKLGRQFARADVVAAVLEAAAALADSGPVVIIADVGKRGGGPLPPHATHRDGRTIDILMPVRTTEPSAPARFPHGDDVAFGYCARFDAEGRYVGTGWEGKRRVTNPFGKGELCARTEDPRPIVVDFAAVARLVRAIDAAAAARGLRVTRVITAPEYVAPIEATDEGKLLGPLAKAFTRRPVWTRHDDHVHIELSVDPAHPPRTPLAPSPKAP